jgi:HEXXH motif-containing protein
MINRHRLPRSAVTALAATSSVLGDLRPVRLSRHLLQLRMLAERAPAERTAAVLDQGLAVLTGLQAALPERVAEVIGAPDAGAWSAWCLRRLSGGVTDEVPLAVDLAHAGALATSVAVSAGVDLEAPVPIRAGRVYLPQLGRLRVAADPVWTVGRLTRSGDRISVTWPGGRAERDALTGPGWEPIRRVRFGADGPAELQLDDVSPYRRLYGYRPGDRLSPAEVRRWRELVAEAALVLGERHPRWAYAVREVLSVLVPLAARGATSGLSATARDSIGAVALTMPSDGRQLALTLVHELQHNYVNLLHNIGPLFGPDDADRYYSPWRDDARPLAGVLHGATAFAGVAHFWRRERAAGGRYAELEFALAVRQLRVAVRTLTGAPAGLTAAGRALTSSIAELVADLETYPVDPAAARLAADLASEHEIGWQIRQALRPAPGAGAGQPVVQSPLRRLALRWMGTDRPTIVARGGADPAGLDLLTGAYPAAAVRYARRLLADPGDPDTVTALLICAAHTTPYRGHPADLMAALRDADPAGRAAILAPWISSDPDG